MSTDTELIDLLRARGLRATPQRRAILGVFTRPGDVTHLSADQVHARAATVVPELSRGTVYAALSELTELGVLSARGSAEPVRYETRTDPHQHFRCRLCLRVFDVDMADPPTEGLRDGGFTVTGLTITATGVCAACNAYAAGLSNGAQHARNTPSPDLADGVAAGSVDTPVGAITIGATGDGVIRVVFEDHADRAQLEEARRNRRGGRSARAHLAEGKAMVSAYFSGLPGSDCTVDWDRLDGAGTLRAATVVPWAQEASYDSLETDAQAGELGRTLGANPIAVIVPCHRIMRGREVPDEYVGGDARRRALLEFERG